jgi:hypothetical protein
LVKIQIGEVIMVSKFKIICAICALLIFTAAFSLLIYSDQAGIEQLDITDDKICDNVNDIINYNIDTSEFANGLVTVTGWAYTIGEPVSTFDVSVALRENGSDKTYILPTQIDNPLGIPATLDVTLTDADRADGMYKNTGFIAKAKASKLKLDINNCDILLIYKNNGADYIIDTHRGI